MVAFNATGRIIDAGLGVGVADEMRCIMHGMDALVVEASSTHVPWQRRFDGAGRLQGPPPLWHVLLQFNSCIYSARVNFNSLVHAYILPTFLLVRSWTVGEVA